MISAAGAVVPGIPDPTFFQSAWFLLIAVLWTGFFVLEGFDYGVGMLLPIVGKNDVDRRVVINSIGPVWDSNEVWLIVAGAAIFAAFPQWYASMFSAFYLALLLVIVCLICRGVSFEYRGKRESSRWRGNFDRMIYISSYGLALLFGVAFGNIIRGVPFKSGDPGSVTAALHGHPYQISVNLFALLNPFALVCGLFTVSIFLLTGSTFLTLKTAGEVRDRARKLTPYFVAASLVFGAVALVWLQSSFSIQSMTNLNIAGVGVNIPKSVGALPGWLPWAVGIVGLVLILATLLPWSRAKDGWAYVTGMVAIVCGSATFFISAFPAVFVNRGGKADSALLATIAVNDIKAGKLPDISAGLPTFGPENTAGVKFPAMLIQQVSSSEYTLKVMFVVACIFTPIVLIYLAWTYWVFRRRVSRKDIPVLPGFLQKKDEPGGGPVSHGGAPSEV